MEWIVLLLSGLTIGVVVAAPVGPVNLICIRRTLAFGRLNGFLTGTGAAIGDGVFAVVVAFGLTAASEFVMDYQSLIRAVGGIVLVALGIHTFRADPSRFVLPEAAAEPPERPERAPKTLSSASSGGEATMAFVQAPVRAGVDKIERIIRQGGSIAGAALSTFLLTITNPATLLGFFAIFSGLGSGLTKDSDYLHSAVLVGAVVAGSALWWLTVTLLTSLFRVKLTRKRLVKINRGSGFVIGMFGVCVLGKVLWDLVM